MLAFVDSRVAMVKVRDKFPDARIVCDNPLLANAPECRDVVEDISSLLDQEEAKRLGEAGIDILLDLDRHLVACNATERYAAVSRQINITLVLRATLCSLIQRSLISARALEEKNESILLAVRDEPRWSEANAFLSSWYGAPQRTLARYGFFGDATIEKMLVNVPLPDSINDTQIDSLAIRLATAPIPHILFYLAAKFGINSILTGKAVFYGKRCDLLDETLAWLAFKGFNLKQSMPPAYARLKPLSYDDDAVDDPFLKTEVLPWIQTEIGKLGVFSPKQVEAVSKVFFDHLAAGMSTLMETRKSIEDWGDILSKGKASAYLTSGIYGPRGVIVHDVLSKLGINLIDFEHGVTTGIAGTSDRRLDVCESTTSDILIACSERSAERFSRSSRKTASRIASVGNADQARKLLRPQLQRLLARRRLGLRSAEKTVMHVSTLICGGNGRPGDDSPAESFVYTMDKELIEKVYSQVSATVLFKPYPVNRYPDQEPYQSLYSVSPNINFVGFEDYRYIRAAADIIVTQASSSTIGWCVAGNIPLVHLQSRSMNALAGEDLYEAFSKAFFCIDTDQTGWIEKLVDLLNMESVEMTQKWSQMEPARRALLESALAGPSGITGRRAAEVVVEEL